VEASYLEEGTSDSDGRCSSLIRSAGRLASYGGMPGGSGGVVVR